MKLLLSDSEAQRRLILGHEESRKFLVNSLATMSPGRMVVLGGDDSKVEVIVAETNRKPKENTLDVS